ncbi:MAG: type II toxin-antitoxin system VapC family toxin [Chloroflexota bacterium]|nr:type II toxin-antitoxin system VapC family toxin [Chloroflexota bacterium]
MSGFLLDTTPLTAYLFARQRAVALIHPWAIQEEAATSILVYGEVIEHLRGRPDYLRHQQALRRLLREVTPWTLTYGILERYADVRRALCPPHGPGVIGDMDTLIAATALERNVTLVTCDQHLARAGVDDHAD